MFCCALIDISLGWKCLITAQICDSCEKCYGDNPAIPTANDQGPLASISRAVMRHALRDPKSETEYAETYFGTRRHVLERARALGIGDDDICKQLVQAVREGAELQPILQAMDDLKVFEV